MERVKSITCKYFSWPLDTSATDLEILNETVSRAADLRAAYFVHATSINPRPHYISRYLNPRPAARHLLKLVSRRQPIPQEQIASRLLLHLAPSRRLIKRRMEMILLSLSLSRLPRVGESVLRVFLPFERATSSGRAWTFSCLACARL